MPGPEPSPNRRRRNQPTNPYEQLPEGGRKGRVPSLPRRKRGEGPWPKWIQSWWREVWLSPMATRYHPETDRFPLGRLARLYEREERGELTKASELKLLTDIEDRYGLNARAKKELRWRIGPTPVEEKPEVAAPPARPDRSHRRREVMKVIEGGRGA